MSHGARPVHLVGQMLARQLRHLRFYSLGFHHVFPIEKALKHQDETALRERLLY